MVTYTDAVDRVIYGGESVSTLTQAQFIDLALAALDQGNASVKLVAKVKDLLVNEGLLEDEG